MEVGLRVEGFDAVQARLGALKTATAKSVVRRSLKKVLSPVAERADASHFTVAVSPRLSPRQRSTERGSFKRSVVSMYVGPVDDLGRGAPHAHLVEFGTAPRFHKSGKFVGAVLPEPFMRPAWDAVSGEMISTLKREIWAEIEKTLARAAAREGRFY